MIERAISRRIGCFDWLIAEACADATWLARLEQPGLLLLAPAEPLKTPGISSREVARVRLGGAEDLEVVVKRFRPRNLLETLKWVWRGTPASRAFHLARRIETLGFPTATPLAAGERRTLGLPREAYLITSYLSAASPLHLLNARCVERSRRVGIVRGLARLYAAMHDAGFCHCDPSLTNFLAVQQPSGGDTITLIDLDGLRQQGEVSLPRAVRDLRRLTARGRIPRRERAWFVVAYAKARKPQVEPRDWVSWIGPLPPRASFPHCALNEQGLPEAVAPQAMEGKALVSAFPRSVESFDQRIEVRPSGGLRWLVRPSRLTDATAGILAAPDRFLECGRVLKPSRSSAVSARNGVVLKRYNLRQWSDWAKNLLRGSKARRCFFRGLQLERCGVPTARPIAMAEVRSGMLIGRSYLLMEEIPGAQALGSHQGNKREAIARLALLLAKLHGAGFTHRDLKGGNLLFSRDGHPYLIDLDGLRGAGTASDKQAVADLARLLRDVPDWSWRPSRTDCARFLAAYCRARQIPDWRWWWREISSRSRQ